MPTEAICDCEKPAIVTDETYCFRCHRPTVAALRAIVKSYAIPPDMLTGGTTTATAASEKESRDG